MDIFGIILAVVNFLSWLLLFIYGMHYYIICVLYLRKKRTGHNPKPKKLKTTPSVTIQLPIYNEVFVVERLIENISKIRWPKSKLEIQVLDDSNDETTKIARKVIAKLRKKGINIKLIRRKNRAGHKAGALKYGLTLTKNKYIAIFDSDFLPNPDFLEKTIPHIVHDKKLAFIQTRWGHINRDYSKFTYAQSLGIDGHFMVEQSARSLNRLWMNFNGTAGIWRKEAIIDAGNWSGDTLTEDLDLSYRAQLKNWTCLFLPNVECPAEIPDTILAYKTQQFRWAKGSIQTAKKLLKSIFKAKADLKNKLEGIIHLTYYSIQFLMMLNIVTLFPLMIIAKAKIPVPLVVSFMLFTVTLFAPVALTFVAQKALKNSFLKMIKALPFMFFLGLGITVYMAIAFMEAIFGKKSSFIRTPKLNLSNNKKEKVNRTKYSIKFTYVLYLEIFFSIFCFAEAYIIATQKNPIFFYFPLIMGISLMYVVFQTIKDAYVLKKMNRA